MGNLKIENHFLILFEWSSFKLVYHLMYHKQNSRNCKQFFKVAPYSFFIVQQNCTYWFFDRIKFTAVKVDSELRREKEGEQEKDIEWKRASDREKECPKECEWQRERVRERAPERTQYCESAGDEASFWSVWCIMCRCYRQLAHNTSEMMYCAIVASWKTAHEY